VERKPFYWGGHACQIGCGDACVCGPEWKLPCESHLQGTEDFDFIGDLRFEIRDFRFCGCRSSGQARIRKVNSGTKTVLLGWSCLPDRLWWCLCLRGRVENSVRVASAFIRRGCMRRRGRASLQAGVRPPPNPSFRAQNTLTSVKSEISNLKSEKARAGLGWAAEGVCPYVFCAPLSS